MNADDLARISLPDLRHLLAEARTRLRATQNNLRVTEALAKGGDEKALGTNEAARKRALIIALDERPAYRASLWEVRRNEQEAEQLAAEIEGRLDERRERELAVRDRLAEALLGLGARDTSDAADQAAEARAVEVLTAPCPVCGMHPPLHDREAHDAEMREVSDAQAK